MRRVALSKPCVVALWGAGIGAACAGAAGLAACLVDPPPDLVLPSNPPTIVYDALQPQQGLIAELPLHDEFVVPIRIPDPSAPCLYELWVDGLPQPGANCQLNDTGDGVSTQLVTPMQELDPAACHTITFTLGVYSATWYYVPSSCVVYDAGALQNGAFPDAASDALPVVAEAGH